MPDFGCVPPPTVAIVAPLIVAAQRGRRPLRRGSLRAMRIPVYHAEAPSEDEDPEAFLHGHLEPDEGAEKDPDEPPSPPAP